MSSSWLKQRFALSRRRIPPPRRRDYINEAESEKRTSAAFCRLIWDASSHKPPRVSSWHPERRASLIRRAAVSQAKHWREQKRRWDNKISKSFQRNAVQMEGNRTFSGKHFDSSCLHVSAFILKDFPPLAQQDIISCLDKKLVLFFSTLRIKMRTTCRKHATKPHMHRSWRFLELLCRSDHLQSLKF